MIDKTLSEKIDKAVIYYINELLPAYNHSYNLMDQKTKSFSEIENVNEEKALEILNYFKKKDLEIKKSNEVIEQKKKIFEKMKVEFNGFHVKEMDNRIKNILNKK